MLNYKLISSDLDGTLLDEEMHVSRENREAIRRYADMGGVFVPNSGRSFFEMSEEVRNLDGVRFIICSDGAAIYDKETSERIGICMNREESRLLFSVLDEYSQFPSIHYDSNAYCDGDVLTPAVMEDYNVTTYFYDHFMKTAKTVSDIKAFRDTMEEVEMVCAFFSRSEDKIACRDRLVALGFTVADTAEFNLEVFSARAGKGNAMLRLAEHLGIKKEETIAMGDSLNDVSMIRAAGLGLAMENAGDAIKAEASAVACRNTEHIVPYLLKTYVR